MNPCHRLGVIGPVQADIEMFEGDNRSARRNPHFAGGRHESALVVKRAYFRLEPVQSFRVAATEHFSSFSLESFATTKIPVELTHIDDIIRIHVFRSSTIVNTQQSPVGSTRRDGIDMETAVASGSPGKNSEMKPRSMGHPGYAIS
jgi:hypothetical protein